MAVEKCGFEIYASGSIANHPFAEREDGRMGHALPICNDPDPAAAALGDGNFGFVLCLPMATASMPQDGTMADRLGDASDWH